MRHSKCRAHAKNAAGEFCGLKMERRSWLGWWWQLIKENLSAIAQKYATHEPQRQ